MLVPSRSLALSVARLMEMLVPRPLELRDSLQIVGPTRLQDDRIRLTYLQSSRLSYTDVSII